MKKSLIANIINVPNNEIKGQKDQQITDKKDTKYLNSKDDINDDNLMHSNEEKKVFSKLTERGIEKDIKVLNTESKKSNNEKENNQRIINKVKVNKCLLCLCFLCFKKRKNVQNILLDEGMGIITQYLDVINIFKKLFKDGKIQEKLQKENDDIIPMSEECLYRLSKID